MDLSICQIVASVNLRTGGPAVSVATLAEELAMLGINSSLATLDYVKHGPQASLRKVHLVGQPANFIARSFRGLSPAFNRQIQRHAKDGLDLIHNHGLWMFPNLYARQAARRNRLPLVISPRGMMEGWALERGRLKKRLVWHLFEHSNLRQAGMFHATSADEVKSLRKLGFRQPVALVPNGVGIPTLDNLPKRDRLEAKFPGLHGKNWLLFLSRLHPKKGLEELLRVWDRLHVQFDNWHLVVAGPDLTGYRSTLTRMVSEANLDSHVTFTGMLEGDDKRVALGHASVFVLPTHSENFGIAIAEALSFSIPVVTTRAAPWNELVSERCGWWIEDTEAALAKTLAEALSSPASTLREMGSRGRILMERKYSWKNVATQMLEAYQWLLEKGPQPPCLILD